MTANTSKLITSRPVLVGELKRIARSRRVHVLRILYLLAFLSGAIMVSQGLTVNPYSPYYNIDTQIARMGKNLFYLYVVCQSIGLGILAPALTAGVISREKENQTFELLLTTDLGPSEILWHRVVSHILALTLLTAAAVPVFFICMFFGGISAGDILAYLGFMAGAMLICCGSAAFFSSVLRTTAGSVLVSYGFIWGVLCIGPILVGVILEATGTCRPDAFLEKYVYVNIAWCYFLFAIGEMPRTISYWAWASSAIATVGFFALAMILASRLAPRSIEWQARRVFTRVMSALDRFYESFKFGNIELLRARAPIKDNPILWRECHTNIFGKRAYFVRIALLLYAPAVLWPLLDPWFFISHDTQTVVLCMEYIALGLILVVCGSATIARERQSRTLGLLLSTPLEPRNILLAKIVGVLRRAMLVFVLMAIHIFFLNFLNTLDADECGYCFANAVVFGAFFLGVAMVSSAYWKSASRATLGTLLISVGIILLPLIAAVLLEISLGRRVAREFGGFVIGISPGYWIVATMDRYGRPEMMWYVIALVAYGTAAVVLFCICGRRFRRLAAEA